MSAHRDRKETPRIILTAHGLGRPPESVLDVDGEMWIGTDQYERVLDHISLGVSLTFDDGFRSCWDIAFPALKRRGLSAQFFVTVSHLDREGYLKKEHLLEMRAAGMRIGTHGMHHRPWRRLSPDEIQTEVYDAKDRLEQILGVAITEAACPFGEYDKRTLDALRRSGIQHIYTSDRYPACPNGWLVPRYTLYASDTLEDLDRILSGREPLVPWVRQAKSLLKRWR